MIPFTTFYGLHYNIVTWTPRASTSGELWSTEFPLLTLAV